MNGCLKGGLIALGLLVVLGVGCTALIGEGAEQVSKEIDEDKAEREAAIEKDVELLNCEPDPDTGWMSASVRVTNNSSERSNYFVEVAFSSPDGTEQYDTGTATVSALVPDQTSTEEASSLSDAPGPYECEVIDITRFTDEP